MPDDTLLAGRRGTPTAITVAIYKSWKRLPDRGWSLKPAFIRQRLRERFIIPIALANPDAKHGFTTMAVSCLLIETLEAFYQGWTSTLKHSGESFKNFFHRQTRFKEFDTPGMAEDFYEHVRCGLLHQGETRQGWTIVRSGSILEGKKINAAKFHGRLAGAIDDYRDDLRNEADLLLRKHFDHKMKFIVEQAL
jgi:hypothetical protein